MQHFVFAPIFSWVEVKGVGPCQPCDNFQELCTDPCSLGLSIIMLQHELMVVDERHNRSQAIAGHSKYHQQNPPAFTCRWASLRYVLEAWEEILLLCKAIVAAAVSTGWPQMIFKVKMLDRKVLNWCDEHSVQGQWLCWTVQQSACPLHAPSRLATSAAVSSDRNAHFRILLLWAA